MKYKYKNLKHVTLHGIEPFGIGIFDKPILGGGIELIEEMNDNKNKKTNKGD